MTSSISTPMDKGTTPPSSPSPWEVSAAAAELGESMSKLILSRPKTKLDDPSSSSSPSPSLPSSASAPSLVGVEKNNENVVNHQVDQFLLEAIQNPRERVSVLRIEQDIEKFILDPAQQQLEFQQLPTSYLRLAAHRVAQHYFLQSMVILDNNLPDGSGSRIIIRKNSDCRLPAVRLADIPVNLPQDDSNSVMKLAIKQRPQKRSHSVNSGNRHASKSSHPKSVEERKEEYNRARARIFNSSSDADGKEIALSGRDTFRHSVSARVENRSVSEEHELYLGRSLSDASLGSSSSGRGIVEPVGRHKANNKVAIIRDRDVDRKDPDYDRTYERYMQRFDPGLGFNGGPYSIQPIFAPTLTYNTEFPHLGPSYRPRIALEHQPRLIPQHLRGPWPAPSTATGVNYGRPETMMASLSPDHVGAHSTSAIYMHPSHYSFIRHGAPFVHPHEHVYQPFVQPQQHPEATFGVARPR